MRDLKSNINAETVLASADHVAVAQTSTGLDLKGYNSVAFIIEVGTITGGSVTPKLQESSDNSTWTDVDALEVVGTLSALATNTNQKVSYNGIKRYVRVATTIVATVTAATYGVIGVRGNPAEAPVAVA